MSDLVGSAVVEPVERWVDVDRVWMHTVRWESAAPTTEAPLLLVHGLGGNTVSWELVAGALATRLARPVVAVDLPGFGRTRAPDRSATFEVHRRAIERLLDAEGPAAVAGNSMGGALGVAVAARRPDLVRALVLVNAAYPRPAANVEQLTRSAWFGLLAMPGVAVPLVRARARSLGPEGLVDATLRLSMERPDELDPALREKLLAHERRSLPETASAYSQAGGSLFRYLVSGMGRDLRRVEAPVLMVHGRRDRLVPLSFARAVARRRSDWELVELSGCGHVPQLEQPDVLVDAVAGFLAGQKSS